MPGMGRSGGSSTGTGRISELTDNNARAAIMIPSAAGGSMIRYDAHLYQCKTAMSGTFTPPRSRSAKQFCALKRSSAPPPVAPPPPPSVRERADVRVTGIGFRPEQPTQRAPVQVRIKIKNDGPTSARPFTTLDFITRW